MTSLDRGLKEVNRMGLELRLPTATIESAKVLYRKALSKNLVKSMSVCAVASAALYASSRLCNVPRTLKEVEECSRASRKRIARAYNLLCWKLGLRLMPQRPSDYIDRFCRELKLSEATQQKVQQFLSNVENKMSGHVPTVVVAGAIYLASILCNERRTQREIAEVASITEVSVRVTYRKIAELEGMDLSTWSGFDSGAYPNQGPHKLGVPKSPEDQEGDARGSAAD